LLVYPNVAVTMAYVLLRPFFKPPTNPEDLLDASKWTIDESGSFPGTKKPESQRLSRTSHPHLRLEECMVHIPPMEAGDTVWWHSDVSTHIIIIVRPPLLNPIRCATQWTQSTRAQPTPPWHTSRRVQPRRKTKGTSRTSCRIFSRVDLQQTFQKPRAWRSARSQGILDTQVSARRQNKRSDTIFKLPPVHSCIGIMKLTGTNGCPNPAGARYL
jgi:hypothetical protein